MGAGSDPNAGVQIRAFSDERSTVSQWFGLEASEGNWTRGASAAAGRV